MNDRTLNIVIAVDNKGRPAIREAEGEISRLGDAAEKSGRRTRAAFDDAGRSADGFAASASRLYGQLAALGAVTAAAAAIASVGRASEEYARAAFQTARVHGESADSVIQKSREMAASVKYLYSSPEIQYAFNKIHDSMARYGLDMQQQERLIARAMDVAAARGLQLAESIDRIESAMRGEAEASEYLGLTLNDTYMKTTAFGGALGEVWENLEEGEKARARYLEFMEQSVKYTGSAEEAVTLAGNAWAATWNRITEEHGGQLTWINERLAEMAGLLGGIALELLPELDKESVNWIERMWVALKKRDFTFFQSKDLYAGPAGRTGPGKTGPTNEEELAALEAFWVGSVEIVEAGLERRRAVEELAALARKRGQEKADEEARKLAERHAADQVRVQEWLGRERIGLIEDEYDRMVKAAEAEAAKETALAHGNAALIAQIETVTQQRITAIRAAETAARVMFSEKEAATLASAAEKVEAFLAVHEHADRAARQVEQLRQEYAAMEETLWKAADAGVVTAEEYDRMTARMAASQASDLALMEERHVETAGKVDETWQHTKERLIDITADWIYQWKISLESAFDLVKRFVAQMVATWFWGQAQMAWIAGTGTGAAAVAGGAQAVGGMQAAGGGMQAAGGGMPSFGQMATAGYNLFNNAALAMTGQGMFRSAAPYVYDAGFEGMGNWMGNYSAGSGWFGGTGAGMLGAGGISALGTFIVSGLMTGDWGQAAMQGVGAGIGAAIGTYILPGIGTLIGSTIGGWVGSLFGGGDEPHRMRLGRYYEYGYTPGVGWTEPEMTGEFLEKHKGYSLRSTADEVAEIGLSLLQTLDTTFSSALAQFGEGWQRQFQDRMREMAEAGEALFEVRVRGRDEEGIKESISLTLAQFGRDVVAPIVAAGKDLLSQAMDGTLSESESVFRWFTDSARDSLAESLEDGLAGLDIDWAGITNQEELEAALNAVGASVEQIQYVLDYLSSVGAVLAQIDATVESAGMSEYGRQIAAINAHFDGLRAQLAAAGVDLERYTTLEQARSMAIQEATRALTDNVHAQRVALGLDSDALTLDEFSSKYGLPRMDRAGFELMLDWLEHLSPEQWQQLDAALLAAGLTTDDLIGDTNRLTASLRDTGRAAEQAADAFEGMISRIASAARDLQRRHDLVGATAQQQIDYDLAAIGSHYGGTLAGTTWSDREAFTAAVGDVISQHPDWGEAEWESWSQSTFGQSVARVTEDWIAWGNLLVAQEELHHQQSQQATEQATETTQQFSHAVEDASRAVDAWSRVVESATETILRIRYGSLNVAPGTVQVEEAGADYQALLQSALSGDVQAAADFVAFAPDYLQMAQDLWKSSQAYQDVFAQVIADLESVQNLAIFGAIPGHAAGLARLHEGEAVLSADTLSELRAAGIPVRGDSPELVREVRALRAEVSELRRSFRQDFHIENRIELDGRQLAARTAARINEAKSQGAERMLRHIGN